MERRVPLVGTLGGLGGLDQLASKQLALVMKQGIGRVVRWPSGKLETEDHLLQLRDSVDFRAIAEGSQPMQLQWLRDGVPIADATNRDARVRASTLTRYE
jgi:hypothetical protein